jgi:hypothetical protein
MPDTDDPMPLSDLRCSFGNKSQRHVRKLVLDQVSIFAMNASISVPT